jgi:hypothetical protein
MVANVPAVLSGAVLLCLVTGCSGSSHEPGGAQQARAAVAPSPVPLHATPSWIRSVCGGFTELRHFCPGATPTPARGVAVSMALGTPQYPLNQLRVEYGGESSGDQRQNRPPRYVGWFVMNGALDQVVPAIFRHVGGSSVPVRDGQANTVRRHTLVLGPRHWGGITGRLALAPSSGRAALRYFHYLVFTWKAGGSEVAIGLHVWEPFRETVQTLHAMVDRLQAVPASAISGQPASGWQSVPMTTPPAWLTGACRSLRTRSICPSLVPAGPTSYISVFSMPHWLSSRSGSDDLLSVEWGAPGRHATRNHPPVFAHLELAAGDLAFSDPPVTAAVPAHNGMMTGREGETPAPVVHLHAWRWPYGGSLLLGDCFGNHLCYRWHQLDRWYQIDMHGWEPFTQTVAALRAVVGSTGS